MGDTPDLGPVPERVAVDSAQVGRLIEDQFPRWAHLPVRPVADGGWDNWTFHLGADLVVRLPSAGEYAQAVEKEQRWLPMLAPILPLPIPVPLAVGAATSDFPHPWSVYGWLDGVTAKPERIAEPLQFAADLAGFLTALRDVSPDDGPRPGVHNWYRGGSLGTFDAGTQRALAVLQGRVDVDLKRAETLWAEALAAPWDGVDHWFHGDLAEGNLLVNDSGQLCAVIDFGTCGVGDPSCDLAVAWTLMTPEARPEFEERLGVDTGSWSRGRGWALWKALVTCSSTWEDPDDADDFDASRRVLANILSRD